MMLQHQTLAEGSVLVLVVMLVVVMVLVLLLQVQARFLNLVDDEERLAQSRTEIRRVGHLVAKSRPVLRAVDGGATATATATGASAGARSG